jgi:type II secretory pathway predicted ATPase ExeA
VRGGKVKRGKAEEGKSPTPGQVRAAVVDEMMTLPAALLEEIRLLMNFETNSEKLLQVILSGQPELDATMNHHSLRQLKQRISLRSTIKPLSVFEINKYIRFRLKQAGAENVNLFEGGRRQADRTALARHTARDK